MLCSHFLFLYGADLDQAFHLAAIQAMLQVGGEVRIFPLLDLDGRPSYHVDPIRADLRAAGYEAERVPVGYEFQKGGNEMLWVRRQT